MRKLSPEDASAAFDILVRHAGQRDSEDDRYSFVYHTSKSEHPTMEYRFVGSLGSGGKFRNNGNNDNVPYVDCYREDETPERKAAIIETNCALGNLFFLAPD